MTWIAVGLTEDIPKGTVVPRRVCDTDLAIWRGAAGMFHAWGDRCPHRGMRLSHGFVRGETLSCIYHGWQYDRDGSCAYVPAHPNLTPPKSICAQSYACKDQDGIVWVSLDQNDQDPPSTKDRQPVRSMDVSLSAVAVVDKMGADSVDILVLGGEYDLALAVQPSTDQACVLHALAGPTQDRKTVSRYLEQMRAELEGTA